MRRKKHPRPSPEETGGDIFALRKDPPATGRAAEEQFKGPDVPRPDSGRSVLTPIEPDKAEVEDSIIIVTSMKNEGCFILEWIAYHLSVGVTHFLVYTNDCDDPTNAVLDRFAGDGPSSPAATIPFNREAGQKPQRGALNDAISGSHVVQGRRLGRRHRRGRIRQHPCGRGDLCRPCSDAAGDPNVISMTWRFFGNRGVHAYEDRWQTEQFHRLRAALHPQTPPRLGVQILLPPRRPLR